MKPKVMIEVRGGMVQCVSSNLKDIDIVIIDYDNANDGDFFNKEYLDELPNGSIIIQNSPDVIIDKFSELHEGGDRVDKIISKELSRNNL